MKDDINYKQTLNIIRHNLLLQRFETELAESKNIGIDNDRVNKLQKIVDHLKILDPNKKKKLYYTDKGYRKNLQYTNSMNDFFDTLQNLEYKKRWNSLKIEHKKNKVNEYIDNLSVSDSFKEKLKEFMKKMLEDKILHTEKYIDYDPANMKILYIHTLEFSEETENISVLKGKYKY